MTRLTSLIACVLLLAVAAFPQAINSSFPGNSAPSGGTILAQLPSTCTPGAQVNFQNYSGAYSPWLLSGTYTCAGTAAAPYWVYTIGALDFQLLASQASPANGHCWFDNVQLQILCSVNGQTTASYGGDVSVQTSNTAQATANVTTDQNLLANAIGTAALFPLNVVNKHLTLHSAGTYNVAAATTITVKAKLCTISGCATGTVVTLGSFTTASQTNTAVTLKWILDATCATVSTGATGSLECDGKLTFDSGATLPVAASIFADSNIAVIASVPLNGALFLQTTWATNTANASDTALARLQTVRIDN